VAEQSAQKSGDEGESKSGRWLVFGAMVVAFWGSGLWQMSDNRRVANEEEIEEVAQEGECEARYVKAWSSVNEEGKPGSTRLTLSELANIRGLCLREQRLAEKAAQRATRE
jgi:hypothetical protein